MDEDKDDIQYLFQNRAKEAKLELILEWGSKNKEEVILKKKIIILSTIKN